MTKLAVFESLWKNFSAGFSAHANFSIFLLRYNSFQIWAQSIGVFRMGKFFKTLFRKQFPVNSHFSIFFSTFLLGVIIAKRVMMSEIWTTFLFIKMAFLPWYYSILLWQHWNHFWKVELWKWKMSFFLSKRFPETPNLVWKNLSKNCSVT